MTFDKWFREKWQNNRLYGDDEEPCRLAWNAAMDEAARLSDSYSGQVYPDVIADEIRKLKTEQ